jgi:histidyl-tRNA synthetase
VFEFESDALGAQRGVGGGGRYDALVEELGGPPTPGVGWAAGVERILLASEAGEGPAPPAVFVALDEGGNPREAFRLVCELRAQGVGAQMEQAGRSLKGQLKHADRLDAGHVAILGADGLAIRDMESGDQREVADVDEAARLLAEELR